MITKDTVNPGIHKYFDLSFYSDEEREIINCFGKEWYVTTGRSVSMSNSTYQAFLIKPTLFYQESFNIDRELIVIFSDYDVFEPRSLDAVNAVKSKYENLRIEEICSVLISKDPEIETKIKSLFKTNQESTIIIPMTYSEIVKEKSNEFFFMNKFRTYFYSRDLFAFESPLRKDIYFFGRSEFVFNHLNRHLSFENSGVFGLRKTGKTSILYAIQRALDKKKGLSVLIDCEILQFKRWNHALYYIIKEICLKYKLKKLRTEEEYTEERAFEFFEEDLLTAFLKKDKKSFLIVFDEIEHITFDISITEHWRDGSDFLKFWHTIRALFQKNQSLFTYLIAGTNPMCVEKTSVLGIDNPLYSQIPFDSFINQFDFKQTREMVFKLGSYMGLTFDDLLCANLTQDFGGHPFLIRHVCSVVNRLCESQRPVKVTRQIYEEAKEVFSRERGDKYSEMILEVLSKYYPNEYYMLERLAIKEEDFFYEFANEDPEYTNHLLGYGILEKNGPSYDFKIDVLEKYLSKKNKYKKLHMDNDDKQKEISERRNCIEPKLRKIIRNQLKAVYGEEKAKNIVISKKYNSSKMRKYRQAMGLKYSDLFDPKRFEIYFNDLRILMATNWEECFRNIFDEDVEKFNSRMVFINYSRKADSHAAQISDSDMESFRGGMSWLEMKVASFMD